jgi:hypothetical protein
LPAHLALGGRDVWERFKSWKLEQMKNPLDSPYSPYSPDSPDSPENRARCPMAPLNGQGAAASKGGPIRQRRAHLRFGSLSGTRSGQTWTEGPLSARCPVRCHKYSHMVRAQQPVISSKHHITNCGWLNKVGPHGHVRTLLSSYWIPRVLGCHPLPRQNR